MDAFWGSSAIFQWTVNVFRDVWADSVGKIFLLTAIGYFLGYAVYGGYFSVLCGGRRGSPFRFSDFSVADLFSILPSVINTVMDLAANAFCRVLKILACGLLLLLVGAAIYVSNFRIVEESLCASILRWLGLFLLFAGFWLLVSKREGVRWKRYLPMILMVVGIILFFLSTPKIGEPVNYPILQRGVLEQCINEITTINFFFLVIVIPYIFGMKVADTAIEFKIFPQVKKLVLKQAFSDSNVRKAPGGASVYDLIPTDDRPYYLAMAFTTFVLIYVAGKGDEKGRSLVIERDLILGIEIQHC